MIKRYGANLSLCSTPATVSNYSVSPSVERTFTFVFLYSIIMAATGFFFFFLIDRRGVEFASSFLCEWSQRPW